MSGLWGAVCWIRLTMILKGNSAFTQGMRYKPKNQNAKPITLQLLLLQMSTNYNNEPTCNAFLSSSH